VRKGEVMVDDVDVVLLRGLKRRRIAEVDLMVVGVLRNEVLM